MCLHCKKKKTTKKIIMKSTKFNNYKTLLYLMENFSRVNKHPHYSKNYI